MARHREGCWDSQCTGCASEPVAVAKVADGWHVVQEEGNLSSNGRSRAPLVVKDAQGLTIARVMKGVPNAEANAALLGGAPSLLAACELAAAFVGMHTGGGVPNRYMGRFDHLLNDPKAALTFILNCIDKAEGK